MKILQAPYNIVNIPSIISKGFRKYISTITKIGGIILFLTVIAILTDRLQILGFFILEYFLLSSLYLIRNHH